MKRNHWLDFLKLTFIIIIAFCHTTWWTNMKYGFLPVEFFFIVSGYFVYASYLKNKSFGKFVTDKIKRLFPTYLVILSVCAIYSLIFPKFYPNSSYEHWWLSLARESVGILLGMVLKKEYVNKWSNTHKVCFNTLGIIAISGAFFSFFSPIDLEWLGIICFVYILANAVSSNGIGSYFNKTKYAKYIPDISLEILLLHIIFIRISVKVADCLGVVQIDVLRYIIYATMVLTVSYIFNKYIIPQIKSTFNAVVNQAIPTIR